MGIPQLRSGEFFTFGWVVEAGFECDEGGAFCNDDHGVNLSKLRALAKRLKTQQELAPALGDG